MIASRQRLSDGFVDAVGEQDGLIVPEVGISERRLHANARRAACKDELIDSSFFERRIEVRLVEPTVSMLVHDDVFDSRLEVGDNLSLHAGEFD